MSKQELTGLLPEGVEKLKEEFQDSPAAKWYDFEERYCLYGIPYQPEEYDGPMRRCAQTASKEQSTGYYRCRFHKGRGGDNPDNLTEGNPKHFMHATDEFLMEHLTDAETDLYHSVLEWAEIYGIDKENDPAAYDDLKLLAKQRVREVKASKYLFEEGEIRDKMIRDEEGQVIIDEETGEPKTEDDTNVISEEYRRLINLISSLKKELVVSRKETMKADDRSAMAGSADAASKAMSELVTDEEKEFDVEEYDSE